MTVRKGMVVTIDDELSLPLKRRSDHVMLSIGDG
jgi:hypothetical protein